MKQYMNTLVQYMKTIYSNKIQRIDKYFRHSIENPKSVLGCIYDLSITETNPNQNFVKIDFKLFEYALLHFRFNYSDVMI